MSKAIRDSDEVAELKLLYDRLALAIERAAATMHMRGHASTAFVMEDTKCVALWDRIREKMPK
jgi:phage terminase Nu1 subunit (DNA packaging protein)